MMDEENIVLGIEVVRFNRVQFLLKALWVQSSIMVNKVGIYCISAYVHEVAS